MMSVGTDALSFAQNILLVGALLVVTIPSAFSDSKSPLQFPTFAVFSPEHSIWSQCAPFYIRVIPSFAAAAAASAAAAAAALLVGPR